MPGVFFNNCISTTPVCCPSRSSILTGLYQHNHKVVNNSVEGNCYGDTWRTTLEPKRSLAYFLKRKNYRTFYAGKYLNQVNLLLVHGAKKQGMIERITAKIKAQNNADLNFKFIRSYFLEQLFHECIPFFCFSLDF